MSGMNLAAPAGADPACVAPWTTAPGAPSVARLLYASQSRIEGSVYAEMERIRCSAVRHNVPAGIATALSYQSGWFIQWKEGPGDALLRTMSRVASDLRHDELHIVHSSRGPRLLHGPWSMAIVQCSDSREAMADRVQTLRQAMLQGVQLSPVAAWRQLSTPGFHGDDPQRHGCEPVQRVLVCASVGRCSFDWVDWLGSQQGQEVVQRRFAGAQSSDVGTCYVDFADAGRALRVVAMARNGLLFPLTRALLSDYTHVVTLLAGRPECDLALVHRVGMACAGLVRPPRMLGVASVRSWHDGPLVLAGRLGLTYHAVEAQLDDCASVWRALRLPLAEGWCGVRQPSAAAV